MKKHLLLLLFCGLLLTLSAQKERLYSPDGKLMVIVNCSTDQLNYSVRNTMNNTDENGSVFISPSDIGLELEDATILGRNPKVVKTERESVNRTVTSPLYRKSLIEDNYNELKISFKGNFQVIFRAYNSGIAYRFVTKMKDSVIVKHETAEFNFSEGSSMGEYKGTEALIPYVNRKPAIGGDFSEQLCTSFENTYVDTSLHCMADDRLAFLPMLVKQIYHSFEKNNGGLNSRMAVITEADLHDYPGMYLKHTEGNSMIGYFAPLPKTWEQGGHNNLQYVVKEREDYIAKTVGTRAFPWRVIAIAEQDKELVDNDLVYLLAEPSKVADISWIKP